MALFGVSARGEIGGALAGALSRVEVWRNADRLLPQHMVVSFCLYTGLDDDRFPAHPFQQAGAARERQP